MNIKEILKRLEDEYKTILYLKDQKEERIKKINQGILTSIRYKKEKEEHQRAIFRLNLKAAELKHKIDILNKIESAFKNNSLIRPLNNEEIVFLLYQISQTSSPDELKRTFFYLIKELDRLNILEEYNESVIRIIMNWALYKEYNPSIFENDEIIKMLTKLIESVSFPFEDVELSSLLEKLTKSRKDEEKEQFLNEVSKVCTFEQYKLLLTAYERLETANPDEVKTIEEIFTKIRIVQNTFGDVVKENAILQDLFIKLENILNQAVPRQRKRPEL